MLKLIESPNEPLNSASSSFVTAAVDEAVEQRVMKTNERIAVMETEMKKKDQKITLLKDEM